MKTKDAISRLSFTISNGNKPNENDKIALNSIIQFINKSDSEAVHENLCFAKLYTLILSDFLSHYNDINFANKALNKELSYPLEYHIKILEIKLKCVEMDNFFKSKGIIDEFIIGKPFSESIKRYEENKKLFPRISSQEFLETDETWDTENVISHLNRNINESLTKYKNV